MWSHQEDLPHRAGKGYESDLSLRYLAPGAFTILPPGNGGPPPDSSSGAHKHRLSPKTKTHRNTAFTIIAESEIATGSRSPSPTGRVSPFRGRGFNPTGSRHASPLPSPPPEERRFPSSRIHQSDAAKRSKIPTLSRRGSTADLFGEEVGNQAISPGRTRKRTNLTKQLSQSLTNITPKHVANKPPPSPRRTGRMKKPAGFQKLSPIIGSSPEPTMTPDSHRLQPPSPSKIPRSRSQPPSTMISPNASRGASRVNSRNPSRNASRNASRDPSPNKLNPKTSYKNVKAKVNSFNSVKPKVPPKPQVPKTNEKQKLERKDSVIRSTRANDNNSNNDSTSNASTSKGSRINSSKNDDSSKTKNRNKSATSIASKGSTSRTGRKAGVKTELEDVEDIENVSSRDSSPDNESSPVVQKSKADTPKNEKKTVESTPKLMDLLSPSTTTVVSTTTTTVTQPLKIESKFDVSKDDDKGNNTVYLPDGRALSATSVSTAMNRMNDTVLDTKTLMKDSNLSSRLSPAATTIIGMSNTNENGSQKPPETVTNTETNKSALPPVETVGRNNNNNHSDPFGPQVTHNFGNTNVPSVNSNNNSVTINVKPNDTNAKINGISPERGVVGLSALPKSADERIKEARTMVATDVQPIRIMVKEKPSDSEVQSGNVRLPVSATNGISERPGLPPPQPPQEEPPATPDPPKGPCGRLLGCCKKKPKAVSHEKEKKEKSGCWGCSKNKKVEQMQDRVSSDASLLEAEANQKMKWWRKMKCCRRKKVGDTTGCFPSAQRKQSWAERTDSITSEVVKKSPKDKCKDFLRTIFCINLCSRRRRKEQEEAINRRASMMSKKKSLTPPMVQDERPKLDAGLVEHTSLMKGAIPVLPVPLAWMCLILNVFLPGIGTIISGFLCLCMGIPRFSSRDGLKQRAGACFIDFFIGCGQLFTVLFCLVGWGWSIWWGVVMVKIAKKYRKIRRAERAMEEDTRAAAAANENHTRDPERGS